jgi:NO-binding membrane sensor protein with MHYT domain
VSRPQFADCYLLLLRVVLPSHISVLSSLMCRLCFHVAFGINRDVTRLASTNENLDNFVGRRKEGLSIWVHSLVPGLVS